MTTNTLILQVFIKCAFAAKTAPKKQMESLSNHYFMEQRAFAEFVEQPESDHTLALLRFALKPFLIRVTVYGAIPLDKWTRRVRALIFRTIQHHAREIIFLPLIRKALPIFVHFIRYWPHTFLPSYRHLRRIRPSSLSASQRAVRRSILTLYEYRRSRPAPPNL